ncbi:MAG TPA: cupredoxin domain-containing protein [Methanotrichaceae archaeon]|nr:cupredoxin domain-containing protein [Methanotrichaceae archaeon]
MALDFRTLIALNITVQIILALALAGAIFLAKRRSLKKHCATMRIIVPVQILAILGIMLPAMSSYTNLPAGHVISGYEVLIHHALGLGVVVLWVYINLVFLRFVKPVLRLKPTMQMAAAFWILSLILGVHIYSQLYTTSPGGSTLPDPQENVASVSVGNISQQNISGMDSLPVLQNQTVSVEIENFIFDPDVITVPAGTTVVWTNLDSAPHTVTSTRGIFDSGVMDEGESFSYTFQDPGTYDYYCLLHPYMKAKVIVTPSEGPRPAAAGMSQVEEGRVEEGRAEEGESEESRSAVAHGQSVLVEIKEHTYEPDSITVPVGTTVVWRNFDPVPHTATSTTGLFDSGLLDQGENFSYTFQDTGTYDYYCPIHPYMKAKVIVTPSEGHQLDTTEVSQPEAGMQPVSLAEPGSEISIVSISTTSPQPSTRVTVDLLAKNMIFDKDKITVIAGSKVFINFVNLDVGVPHNFAVYTGPEATRTIFQGRIVIGPTKITYAFDAPVDEGIYFFRCDVHPEVMTGQFYVVSSDVLESSLARTASQGQPEMDMTVSDTAAAMPDENARNRSAAAPQSVTVDLVAENNAFDKSTITVPAGARVTVNFNNRDSGVPHNFAAYETDAAEEVIFVGEIVTGLAKVEYTFDAPAVPGTYFFRCDIHPTQMTGQLIVE